uniref:NADP-dependent oxidoreductase domain-containing protein n=1 Tax=Nelumbo nucifera TaxID=4432 RepID=A0A822YX06_NELNU|nr:TPA_asm: hypothetical protein HUJ06_006509 [Nelumbo nucifera]
MEMEDVIPEVSLSAVGDKAMPIVGMGTTAYPPVDDETIKSAVVDAIRVGYRHFDTAFAYRSEKPLGEAIAEALRLGLIKSRSELFISTKLWCSFAERNLVVPALKLSLGNLKLEYVDLFLIHWPLRLSQEVRQLPIIQKEHILPLDLKSVWEGMEQCQALGLTKSIGISNFSCKKLHEILAFANIPPAVNQVEMNPLWQQKKLREYCKAKGIHVTAYSPLGANGTKWGDNRVVGCNVLEEIAKARGKTTAQQEVSMVFKTFSKERMKENLQIFDWSLTGEELDKISKLPQRKIVLSASIFGHHDLTVELDEEI